MQRIPATRPSYVISQLPPPVAHSGPPGRAAAARGAPQLLPTLDPCLVVVINRTAEVVSLSACSETPAGPSFLDALSVDLEPEGIVSFSACLASDLVVDFYRGPHALALAGNELRLLPGGGLKQKMSFTPSGFPTKHVLVVEVERLVESRREPPRLALADVVLGASEEAPEKKEALRKSLEALPAHCTVLWPRGRVPEALGTLSAEELVRRLTVPMALFFHSKKGCSETLLDNSTLRIAVSPAGEILFEVPGEGAAKGALFLKSSAAGLVRTTERFQLVYLCDAPPR
jgi:hypothetical protein